MSSAFFDASFLGISHDLFLPFERKKMTVLKNRFKLLDVETMTRTITTNVFDDFWIDLEPMTHTTSSNLLLLLQHDISIIIIHHHHWIWSDTEERCRRKESRTAAATSRSR